jgi:tRNA-guanine family transglycosylase
MLASTLISIHNVYTLVRLVKDARQAIQAGCYAVFAEETLRTVNIEQ